MVKIEIYGCLGSISNLFLVWIIFVMGLSIWFYFSFNWDIW